MAALTGRLVLHRLPSQPGVNSRPPETATTVSASHTLGTKKRRAIAAASVTIALTAPANALPRRIGHHRIRRHSGQPHG
ncbi:hypothetical protein LAUMK35_04751 [Mycobacterium pseudokansasii]|uniref:Uncharacterized protein n=1 Tax=Mycobacterium pseudokansasii TaxID=2341080 RepID=A0A498QWG3_9MYCO|nr:hypothetical protein LAUMK35_04751 [Mycobacterium pseudokansasii]VBA32247.1 hypothetical protein LAUMK21_04744 [Mycobacterium pseudokansasii]VBA54429.1 hypothetical protein LAUMK142_04652 [Mycobacterium pseudokansasii]